MHQPQLYTSWLIACRSPEACQALQRWLASHIDLNRILTDTVRTMPYAVETVQTVPHRLGDYFADIRMLPARRPDAFRLLFHRLARADRFWKDLMVNILQEIEPTPEKASITLEYKGDQDPSIVTDPTAGTSD
jgi:hypothetical protein